MLLLTHYLPALAQYTKRTFLKTAVSQIFWSENCSDRFHYLQSMVLTDSVRFVNKSFRPILRIGSTKSLKIRLQRTSRSWIGQR